MAEGRTGGPFRQVRIDTWKSIARHLGRSSRTVQRWHREYGLPVHRLGVDSGSIFAYADELDSWLRNRDRTPSNTLFEVSRPASPHGLHLHWEPEQFPRHFRLGCIPGSGRQRSAELVAFANRLWATVSNANLKIVAKCFREAIDLDPGNAEAFAGLSHALIAQGLMGMLRIPAAYVTAKAALDCAKEIDAELPAAKCAAAFLKIVWERDWNGARCELDDLRNQRSPGTRTLIGRALLHIAEGCPAQASSLLGEFIQQNALSAEAAALRCWSQYLAEDFSDALNLVGEARSSGQSAPLLDAVEALASIRCEKPDAYLPRVEALVNDSPRHELLRGVLGLAYALNGQAHRANATLDALVQAASGEKDADSYAFALVLVGLDERREAIQWLEQSYRSGSLCSLGFPVDPILKSLRDEPGYRILLSRISYPLPHRHGPLSEKPLASFVEAWRVSGS
jgi:tetratricopeptide (TPR) repeat protein